MKVEDTLKDLVAIDSVSQRTNVEIISYIARRCETNRLKVTRLPYVDDAGVEKINLVAQTSVGDSSVEATSAVELALVGHTDTVPYDPAWIDALRLTEKDGKLFGRGACDTKAFISAALTAIESIDLSKLKKPLALVFTADEEIGCLGAKRLAEAKPFTARYAIVGEPTSLQPMRAGKGYCLAEITLRGREAHSAYPQIGASAIYRAARLIGRIEQIADELKQDQRAGFDPPYTTMNVGLIEGGTARNIIAGECHFTLEWRTIPGQASDYALNLVRQAVADLHQQDADFICEIDAARADESFETRDDSLLVHFLKESSGKESGTVAFGTEAPSLIALGAEAVVFGPGDIRVAHRTGEFVPVEQLDQCVRILRQAIERFCC
ncbi:MAG: acetylornithine deacetylase [Blastocatellia bacterium]|jgi:acetylornithine deacetylase|nr:acetylornithine deacetylase [Blastocatellia bacterium]